MPRGFLLAFGLSLLACSAAPTEDDGAGAAGSGAGESGAAGAGGATAGSAPTAGSAGSTRPVAGSGAAGTAAGAGGKPGAAGSSAGGAAGQPAAGRGGAAPGGSAGSAGAGKSSGAGGATAGTGGTVGSGGAPDPEEGGEGGATDDDWLTRPVEGCPGFTDVRVPEGKCVWIHGRWAGGTSDCRSTSIVNTCSVVVGPRQAFRISADVPLPNVATVEFLDLIGDECPAMCDQ